MTGERCAVAGCGPSRRVVAAGLGLLPFGPAASSARAVTDAERSFRALPKAAWVWDFSFQRAREIADIAERFGIATLFVSIPIADRARLLGGDAALIRQLDVFATRGIALWALAGDPAWVEAPASIPRPLQMLLDIQTRLRPFAGLQLDVEPQALPRWRAGPEARIALSEQLIAFLGTVKSKAGPLPIDFAAHPMLAGMTLPGARNAMAAVCRHVDSISLMAYRDSAAATLRLARPAIDVLEAAEKSWRMAVLVYASQEQHTSFSGFMKERFFSEIQNLDLLIKFSSKETYFKGLAFEDHRGLRELLLAR